MIHSVEVSVIIPTFNRGLLLSESLNSVRKQTFENWECIVVDDGSSDDTEEIVSNFVNIDSRFKYIKRPSQLSKGANNCRNYGFQKSKGLFIQWLDDDDLLSSNKLESQLKILKQQENGNSIAVCDWDLFWPGKKIEFKNFLSGRDFIETKFFFEEMVRQQTFIPPHVYLIPRKIVVSAGLWNTLLTLNDDAEYFTRILVNSDKIFNASGCYVFYREHGGERISRQRGSESLKSHLMSLELMNVYLKAFDFESKAFFRWKLLRVFHANWMKNRRILEQYYFLFKENGVDLKLAYYYRVKHNIYRKLYPVYKKKIKNKFL